MSNLEKYINEDYDDIDLLIKLAIIHYQFESIHPFYDGNGRTGRIINEEIEKTAEEIKGRLPKIYSKELIELLFFEFYTKRVFIENGLNVSRKTASNYLAELEKEGFLTSEKIGKERIYVNKRLFNTVEKAGSNL